MPALPTPSGCRTCRNGDCRLQSGNRRNTISINGTINWYIESESGSLTGDEPIQTLIWLNAFPIDEDDVIGETYFTEATATNVSLGNVAATGLPLSDLTISWNPGLGTALFSAPVSYDFLPIVPEPTTLTLATLSLLTIAYRPRMRRRC